MWERANGRLQREKKVLQKKVNRAIQNGERVSGRDLARLNRVAGTIQKKSVYNDDGDYEDDY
jgi:hypothetical protein